ncbi:MAG: CPBP family intramembrane metalloprotease [Clostridia bacterium]|nr:CPBP family intramembrane metalloprotease [Clostridia bacterium]
MRYLKMTGFIFLYLSVYLILQIYLSGVAGLFFSIIKLMQDPMITPSEITAPLLQGTIFILAISAVVSFLIYWFTFWLRKENIFRFCKFHKISVKNIGLVCVLGVAMVFPVSFIVEVLKIDQLSKMTEEAFNMLFKNNNVFVLLLGIGIVGPIIEEIIFRGLIQNELKRNMNIAAALFIQALLFGVYHLNLTQAIYAFPLGLILGLVFLQTGSIWGSILVHIFFNSTSVVLSKIPGESPEFLNSPVSLIIAFAISIVALILLTVKSRRRELA